VSQPQVAFDAHGNAVAVWKRSVGVDRWVEVAYRQAGGSWQAPVTVGWCGESRCEPQIAFDGQGDAVAAWEAYTGSTFVVESSYKPARGGWRPSVMLSPAEIPGAAHPRLALDNSGDAIVAWDRGSAIDAVTQAAFMTAGGTWQAPVDVSPEGSSAFEPQVAFDAQGNALVLWYHFESYSKGTYEYLVQSAFRPAGGTWQAPVDVSTKGLAGGLHLAFDGHGDATAVWDRWSDGFLSPRIVQTAARPVNDTWQTPVNITAGADELDQPKGAQEPAVAMDAQGDAVAVWAWEFGGVIQAAFKLANGAWGAPVGLSAFGESASNPDVAFDGQGDALAVWTLKSSSGENETIQAAFRPAHGVWQAPEDLSSPLRSAYSPQIALDGQGDALVAWNGEYGIQAAGYVAKGPILNDVSIPAEGAVGQPLGFSVSPLDVWSVLGETNWSFGDGTIASGLSVNHTYGGAGTYEVTLRSVDLLGNVTGTSAKVTVVLTPASPASRRTPSRQTSELPALTPRAPAKSVVRCIVPRLHGKSLSRARRALQNAHCALGRISRPPHRRSVLVVVAQSVPAGEKLGDNAPVTLRLGSPRPRREMRTTSRGNRHSLRSNHVPAQVDTKSKQHS
jgi:hypothetical protein